mmetsp:Transcript_39534/g.113794  ORF Transcript_39534/g.113794 Transcript_39534/m.113794 type:complete len:233 (+) Transcript_39534:410-1108(+)
MALSTSVAAPRPAKPRPRETRNKGGAEQAKMPRIMHVPPTTEVIPPFVTKCGSTSPEGVAKPECNWTSPPARPTTPVTAQIGEQTTLVTGAQTPVIFAAVPVKRKVSTMEAGEGNDKVSACCTDSGVMVKLALLGVVPLVSPPPNSRSAGCETPPTTSNLLSSPSLAGLNSSDSSPSCVRGVTGKLLAGLPCPVVLVSHHSSALLSLSPHSAPLAGTPSGTPSDSQMNRLSL